MSEKVHQVVIVGAGVAGLAAAKFLNSHGITDILILEAKSKPGGRIESYEYGDKERVELGAQWIHGEENDFCKLVKESGHLHPSTSWEGKGDFLLPNGDKVRGHIISEILDWLENTIGYVEEAFCIEELQNNLGQFNKHTFSSMGKFLKDRFLAYLKDTGVLEGTEEYDIKIAVFQWGMSFQRIDNSCYQMTDLSLFRWSEFQVNSGELYNNFKQGASSFVHNVLANPLESIRCNSPVENIDWSCNNWVKIRTRNGQLYFAQCVLVTCSIGILKTKLETLFTPLLPSFLGNAINATGFGPIAKIFLIWDSPWWPQSLEGFQFVWYGQFINCCDDEERTPTKEELRQRWFKSITGFDPVTGNSKALLGWLGGHEAKFVETLSEEIVGEECVKILRDFTGFCVPRPDKVIVSKWNSDEFVRGAYCYRSAKGDAIHGDISAALSKPVVQIDLQGLEKPTILLAGEALSKTHYSTLHGAFESGETQASKITEYFRKPKISQSASQNTQNCELNGTILPNLVCQFSKLANIN